MRDESAETVKEAVYQASLDFLNHHLFLVETKRGKDFIVWNSSIRNKRVSDFYILDRTSDFLKHAKKAGEACLKQLKKASIPDQEAVFNEGIGRALFEFIEFQKTNPMEVEMQEIARL